MALLEIDGLNVSYRSRGRQVQAVSDLALDVAAGEAVALVGESGSGKTTTASAVVGLLPATARRTNGQIRLGGTELTALRTRELRRIRGARIGLIPQDPGSSLNPSKRIGDGLAEVFKIHRWGSRAAIARRVLALLDRVGLDDPERRARQYPHELSGGMRQRVLIAGAIALEPELLIADEPTSALDVTVQQRILDLIDSLRRDSGTAVLLVTHDLAVAADRADRIAVLKDGRLREVGPAAQLIDNPTDAYTRQLLADAPAFGDELPERSAPATHEPAMIIARGLGKDFAVGRGAAPIRAVRDVSFTVAPGATHALVGESGSGKTTTARLLLGFERPTSGSATVAGCEVAALSGEHLRQFRRSAQLIQQNPYSSLDPRQAIRRTIGEPLRNFERPTDLDARVDRLLEQVALPRDVGDRLPAELSGGQRQRVAIARALILSPRVLVLDEPVSALDVTVQAQILDLLAGLQAELGLSYLLITHDLAVVRRLADTVSVMQAGTVVETGTVAAVFERPRADYTRTLIAAIPGHAGKEV